MKKNNILFLVVIAIMLFICPREVKAIDYLKDDCVEDGSCMVLCTYETKDQPRRLATIYYKSGDSTWKVSWSGGHKSNAVTTATESYYDIKSIGFDNANYVFHQENVYTSNEKHYKNNGENFTCPANAYFDYSALRPWNELCFDNNGKWCEKQNNIGTKFSIKATKTYDFVDSILTEFNAWYGPSVKLSNTLTCDEIYNGNTDTIVTNASNNFLSYLKLRKFLNTSDIPDFMKSSSSWTSINTILINDVREAVNKCKEETSDQCANGTLNAEECQDRETKLDEAEDVAMDTLDSELNFRTNNATKNNWNKEIQCEDIFTDDPGSVGWMLNTIFNYIKIIGPILVVLLSSIDFIKAVVGTDEKAMKEAQSKLVIRLVAAVALFLIPTLVQLLLSFINQAYCSFM